MGGSKRTVVDYDSLKSVFAAVLARTRALGWYAPGKAGSDEGVRGEISGECNRSEKE
jgi:hypothetical protein